ncbi:hypothetical protein M2391_003484, partial [Myroides odoratus]|nr:hypothetical protein [Myroides odoratus]
KNSSGNRSFVSIIYLVSWQIAICHYGILIVNCLKNSSGNRSVVSIIYLVTWQIAICHYGILPLIASRPHRLPPHPLIALPHRLTPSSPHHKKEQDILFALLKIISYLRNNVYFWGIRCYCSYSG